MELNYVNSIAWGVLKTVSGEIAIDINEKQCSVELTKVVTGMPFMFAVKPINDRQKSTR